MRSRALVFLFVMTAYQPVLLHADSGAWQLTFDGASSALPSWSPDGSLVAHSADRTIPRGIFHLWMIPATGGALTQITAGFLHVDWASWSPDGSRIAFAGDYWATGSHIWIVMADGGGLTRLTDSGTDEFPSWAPDGSRIVFVSKRDGARGLWMISASGGGATKLDVTNTGGGIRGGVAWSPDGARIAFSRIVEGTNWANIAVVPATGGGATVVTPVPDRYRFEWNPTWSPDGSQIAFTAAEYVPGYSEDVWVVASSGGVAVQMTDDSARDGTPAWSPDGSTIAFTSYRTGSAEIWLMPSLPPVSIRQRSWGAIKGGYRE